MKTFSSMLIVILLLCGCSSHKTFSDIYPGDIKKISKVEISNGPNSRSFTDISRVNAWIDKVKGLTLKLDPNQAPRTGNAYSISLFEGDLLKLKFFSNYIGGKYYILGEDLMKAIIDLYQSDEKSNN
ncbi:MAG: hypothetical protein JWM44_3597 [Bacilli bacterium]|nr:hypothetical protein [Bacilli bacterium]